MYKRAHFIITVQPQHITCTQATTDSGRCFVTCRIKETFLPLTQAFSYIWANTRQWETLSTVLRQASTASPQVSSGKWWESGLYRSIFTVWRWGRKNNTTKFFLWQEFRFLEITFHKAKHDYSAVIVEIPRHSLFCKQLGTLNPMYTILTVHTKSKKRNKWYMFMQLGLNLTFVQKLKKLSLTSQDNF